MNNFSHPVNVADSAKIFECSVSSISNEEAEFRKASLDVRSLGPLLCFVETGLYSNQPYQPSVNHRLMNFDVFVYSTASGDENEAPTPPLMQSMVYPQPHTRFSLSNRISIMFYEVEESSTTDNDLGILSCGVLCNKETHLPFQSRINGRIAKKVTLATLQRTLALFNHSSSLTNEPTLSELAGLAKILGNWKLDDEVAFRKFIEDTCLSRFFKPNPDASLETNFRHFGQVLRSLTPLRIAVYDGQHRFMLCKFFAEGHFLPDMYYDPGKPPSFPDFETAKSKMDFINKEPVAVKDFEYLLEQEIVIGHPSEENMKNVLSLFRKIGNIATKSAKFNIKHKIENSILEWMTYMQQKPWIHECKPLDVCFWTDPYSEVTLRFKNHSSVWLNELFSYLVDNGKEDSVMSEQMSNSSNFDVIKNVLKLAVLGNPEKAKKQSSKKKGTPCTDELDSFLTDPMKPKLNGAPAYFSSIVATLKFLMYNPKNIILMHRFLSGVILDKITPNVPSTKIGHTFEQYPFPLDKARSFWCSKGFFRYVLQRCVIVCRQYLVKRMYVELLMLKIIYLMEKNHLSYLPSSKIKYVNTDNEETSARKEALRSELRAEMKQVSDKWNAASSDVERDAVRLAFPIMMSQQIIDIPLKEGMSRKSMKVDQNGKLCDKLEYAIESCLTTDLLESILLLGPSPKLYSAATGATKKPVNAFLEVYLL